MNNNKYIVFKISDNLKEKFINYYLKYPARKTPPYAVFQVINYDTIITLYESGKVMFQGLSADIEASIWIEQERIVNKRIISLDKKEKKKESPKVFYDTDTTARCNTSDNNSLWLLCVHGKLRSVAENKAVYDRSVSD